MRRVCTFEASALSLVQCNFLQSGWTWRIDIRRLLGFWWRFSLAMDTPKNQSLVRVMKKDNKVRTYDVNISQLSGMSCLQQNNNNEPPSSDRCSNLNILYRVNIIGFVTWILRIQVLRTRVEIVFKKKKYLDNYT